MYIEGNLDISKRFVINGFRIHIYEDGKVIFKRVPENDNWMDTKHKKIIVTLNKLYELLSLLPDR